jgi:hypothetical protein
MFTKPSLLSAALFSIATFIVGFCIIGIYASIWLLQPLETDDAPSSASHWRQSDVIWIATTGACVVSIFAGRAWRLPASIRFHCCFWAGQGLLCLSLVYVCRIIEMSNAGGGYDVWIAPLYSAFTITLGLVLLLTAMFLDNGLQSHR